jgi:hypothetical protein
VFIDVSFVVKMGLPVREPENSPVFSGRVKCRQAVVEPAKSDGRKTTFSEDRTEALRRREKPDRLCKIDKGSAGPAHPLPRQGDDMKRIKLIQESEPSPGGNGKLKDGYGAARFQDAMDLAEALFDMRKIPNSKTHRHCVESLIRKSYLFSITPDEKDPLAQTGTSRFLPADRKHGMIHVPNARMPNRTNLSSGKERQVARTPAAIEDGMALFQAQHTQGLSLPNKMEP